jgi:hypothetical protein
MANASVNTYSGRSILWNRMKGSGTEGRNIGWGDSALTASAAANVNLFKPQTEARTAGTSTLATTTFLADTYQVVGTVTCAVGAKTITEAGLFDTTTLSNTTTVSVSMTAAQTNISTGAVGSFPTTGNYYAQLENETILVTGANNTSLTIVRGRLGSTSAVHSSGVPITIGGDGGASGSGATSEQTATVAAANGGAIFAHADFAGIALSVSDAIAFTWLDTLT